jgi:phosphatidylserine/phosphatidylglycerophosphate/cardiolipin synthase-like enzyme
MPSLCWLARINAFGPLYRGTSHVVVTPCYVLHVGRFARPLHASAVVQSKLSQAELAYLNGITPKSLTAASLTRPTFSVLSATANAAPKSNGRSSKLPTAADKELIEQTTRPSRISVAVPKLTTSQSGSEVALTINNPQNSTKLLPSSSARSRLGIVNLNSRLQETRHRNHSFSAVQGVEVLFADIAERVAREIASNSQFVVGCMAWLTEARVLEALSAIQGVSIVVTNDSILNNKWTRARYDSLPIMLQEDDEAVRCVGLRTGGMTRALMHHKFFVGLRVVENKLTPVWVVTGSFNATMKAESNVENALIIRDQHVAEAYYQEYLQVLAISKPLPRIRRA